MGIIGIQGKSVRMARVVESLRILAKFANCMQGVHYLTL